MQSIRQISSTLEGFRQASLSKSFKASRVCCEPAHPPEELCPEVSGQTDEGKPRGYICDSFLNFSSRGESQGHPTLARPRPDFAIACIAKMHLLARVMRFLRFAEEDRNVVRTGQRRILRIDITCRRCILAIHAIAKPGSVPRQDLAGVRSVSEACTHKCTRLRGTQHINLSAKPRVSNIPERS